MTQEPKTAIFHALIAMVVKICRERGIPGDAMLDALLNHAFEAGARGVDIPGRIKIAERLVRASSPVLDVYRVLASQDGSVADHRGERL